LVIMIVWWKLDGFDGDSLVYDPPFLLESCHEAASARTPFESKI
jgi:hypothetical protein